MSIPEANWRDLSSLAKLQAGQKPSLLLGGLSNPDSWLGSLCCCCRVTDPEIVNQYLQAVIGNVSTALARNVIINRTQYDVIKGAMSSLDRLASDEGSKAVRTDSSSSSLAAKAREVSSLFAEMKRSLETNAQDNESWSALTHGRDARLKAE